MKPIKRVDAAVLLRMCLVWIRRMHQMLALKMYLNRAKGAVNALKEAGITNGKSTDQFGSSQPITRGEMAIWLQKGFELKGILNFLLKMLKATM